MSEFEAEAPAVVLLSASQLFLGENARFSLKTNHVDELKESIRQEGGINTPIEVEELLEPTEDGKTHSVTVGFHRVAAIIALNEEVAEEGREYLIPATVHNCVDDAERLRRQSVENIRRKDLTPMDKAVVIRRMLDAGINREEIRATFSVVGGRKGTAVQPASNSHINMLVSFLDFPKKIQTKIDQGLVGIGTAYELHKAPRDKWEAILERAEAARMAQVDREEADEAKLLKNEEKAQAVVTKVETAKTELETARAEAEKAEAERKAKADAAAEAYRVAKLAKEKGERDAATAAYQEAEKESKEAEKAAIKAEGTVAKLEKKVQSTTEAAADRAKKLIEARKNKKTGKKGPDAADIQRAAAEEGVESQYVPLKAGEMRKVVEDLCLPSGGYLKVQKIGEALKACFAGITTDKQLFTALAKITGESKK